MGMISPLTKRAQALAFGSCGLAILSHKGRGKTSRSGLPQTKAERAAPYLSPCGRGYEGRVNAVNPWPKLVRGILRLRRIKRGERPRPKPLPTRGRGLTCRALIASITASASRSIILWQAGRAGLAPPPCGEGFRGGVLFPGTTL